MAATAQADEPWPTFGNPYVFTEQGGEAIFRAVCAGIRMPNDPRRQRGGERILPRPPIPGWRPSTTRFVWC
jgi:hypothetical protein